MRRLLAALAAAATLAPAATAATRPPKPFTADEIRWYLAGFVDASTPFGWGVTAAHCEKTPHAFDCIVAARTAAGRRACYRAVVDFSGRFVKPLHAAACTAASAGSGPAS